jgi:cytochrome c biogenesis protein CcdA
MEITKLSLSFTAGLLAIMSPCAFPMLPSYLAYFLNTEGTQIKIKSAIIFGIVTITGFMSIFISIGLIPSYIVNSVSSNSEMLTILIGILLIILGVLNGWTNIMSRIPYFSLTISDNTGISSFFVYGLAYGLASLTCSLPIFLLLILQSTSSVGLIDIFLSYAAYGLGAATIIIPLSIAVVYSKVFLFRRFLSLMPYMKRISGGVLILSGFYMIWSV